MGASTLLMADEIVRCPTPISPLRNPRTCWSHSRARPNDMAPKLASQAGMRAAEFRSGMAPPWTSARTGAPFDPHCSGGANKARDSRSSAGIGLSRGWEQSRRMITKRTVSPCEEAALLHALFPTVRRVKMFGSWRCRGSRGRGRSVERVAGAAHLVSAKPAEPRPPAQPKRRSCRRTDTRTRWAAWLVPSRRPRGAVDSRSTTIITSRR